MLRGAWRTLRSGFTELEGGSTITAQLIKNTVLTSSQDPSRKVSEAVLAWTLEGVADKSNILEWYLNQVAYGYSQGKPIVGVEQAARYFFGRSAEELSLLESAILAGVVQAPSDLNYFVHKDKAMRRAKVVLQAMVDNGDISERQMALAMESERPKGTLKPINVETRSFMEWVLSEVRAQSPALEFDTTTRIPIALQVISQWRAEKAFRNALGELPTEGEEASYVTMGFDGSVVVMIGQRDFSRTQLNLVTHTNSQAASAFKPFVYATALEQGKTKATVSLADALAISDNRTALDLADAVGIDAVADLARRMGILSPLRADGSLALGGSEVNLLELVTAYVPFATGGLGTKAYGHFGVIKKGEIIDWTIPPSTRVLSREVAQAMNDMLRAVVRRGTGTPARSVKFAAGKTGTSDEYRDAWFIGMTRRHASGIWIGRIDDTPMAGIRGAMAAGVWARIENALPDE